MKTLHTQRMLAAVLCLAVVFGLSTTAFAQERILTTAEQGYANKVKNGSFESWSQGAQEAPNGWQAVSSPTIGQDEDEETGAYAVQVTGNGAASGIAQTLIPVERNSVYTFSFWYKSSLSGHTARVRIAGNVSGEIVNKAGLQSLTWNRHVVTFSTGATDSSISIELFASEGGTISFDGVMMNKGAEPVAFRPKSINETDDHIQFGDLTVQSKTSTDNITLTANNASLAVDGNTVIGDAASDTMTVNATATFNENVVVNGSITADSLIGPTVTSGTQSDSFEIDTDDSSSTPTLTFGANGSAAPRIETQVGDLTIAPAGGDTNVTGNLAVTGTFSASNFSGSYDGTINASQVSAGTFAAGDFTFQDNLTVNDDLTVNGTVSGSGFSGWDTNGSDDLTTATSFGGEVSGTYDAIVLDNDALDDQYIELGDTFAGEVSGTYGAIVIDNDALDDQYIELADSFGGDVSGVYSNLQLGANVVGANELSSTAIQAGDIEAGDLPADGYASTYVNVTGDTMTGTLSLPSNGLTIGTDQLAVSGGNIGVGTTGPVSKLHIVDNSSWQADNDEIGQDSIYLNNTGRTAGLGNFGASIAWGMLGLENAQRRAAITSVQTTADPDQVGLAFFTHGSTSATANIDEVMRINAAGNVGIATTNPTVPLHVAGAAKIEGALDMNSQKITSLGTPTLGTDAATKAYVDDNVGSGLSGSGTANYVTKWTDSDTLEDSLIFDDGSYVGIGTTNPATALEVAGTITGDGLTIDGTVGGTGFAGWDTDASDDLTTANYTGTLDSVYVNVDESPTSADITGSFQAGLTVGANAVALATDTTGAYVATITGNTQVGVSGSGSENAAVSLSINNDSLDFAQMEDTLDLDAATQLNLGNYNYTLNMNSIADFIISDTGTPIHIFTDEGRVGLGTTSPSERLEVNGNIVAASQDITERPGNTTLINLGDGATFSGTGGDSTLPGDGNRNVGSAYYSFGTGTQTNNAAEGAYCEIDFGNIYKIKESRIYFYANDNRNYWYKIKYSTDGSTWKYAVGTANNTGWVTSRRRTLIGNNIYNPTIDRFENYIEAQYVRIYANGNLTNNGNHIYEWELFSQLNPQINWYDIDGRPAGLDDGDTVLTETQVETYVANDVTTGYLPKDNGNAFTDSLIFDDGSHIGIGVSNPTYTLQVAGDIYATGTITGAALDDNDWTVGGGNVYRTTGNVGIGLSNPSEKLEVDGNISIQADDYITGGSSNKIIVEDDTNTGSAVNSMTLSAINRMILGFDQNNNATGGFTIGKGTADFGGTNWVDIMTIGNSGNGYILGNWDVDGTITGDGLTIDGTVSGTGFSGWDTNASNDLTTSTSFGGDVSGTYNNLQLAANSVGANELASTAIQFGDIEAGDLPTDGYASTYVNVSGDTMTGTLNLASNGLTVGTKQMVVSGGNIGIGTTNPTHVLHVEASANGDNIYYHYQENGTTGERDVFTIEDGDNGGGSQDQSSVLRVEKSGYWNSGATNFDNGSSNIEVVYSGTLPDEDNSFYYINGYQASEGAPQWGVDLIDADFLTTGGVYTGMTSTDPSGTLVSAFSDPHFYATAAGDGYFAGSVGIGTTNPTVPLHVAGAAKITGVLDMSSQKITSLATPTLDTDAATKAYVDSAAGSGLAGSGTTNYISKWTPDGTTLGNSQIFDNGTNVGIGITNSGYKLYVNGTTYHNNTVYYGSANRVISWGSDGFVMRAPSGENISLSSNGGTNDFVINAGKVGIGTTDPATALDIANGTLNVGTGEVRFVNMDNYISDDNGNMQIEASGDVSVVIDGNAASPAEDFYIKAGTAETPVFTVQSSGNVGIGTTNPQALLDVAGTLQASQAGDTGIAHDLVMTNIDSSNIKSYGPLTIKSGTDNDNHNLVLEGSGTGKVYVNDDLQVTGDVILPAVTIPASGTMSFGGDTVLYRSAANTLKTDDVFNAASDMTIGGNLAVTGTITASTNETINGIDINAGAISDVTTLAASGAITAASIDVSGNSDANTFRINGTNVINSSRQATLATDETINGIDINAGAISDVTTLDVNSTADFASTVDIHGTLDMNNQAITNINWASSDDGAGSGLDADMLDGVEGANYTREDLTMLGKTGNVSLDAVTDTAAEWANLPVGYARMISSAVGTAGGSPDNNAGYFIKTGNRDVSGGWGGMWVEYNGADHFIGRSTTNSTFATWDKLWNSNNDGSGSGLDADTIDGLDSSQLMSSANISGTTNYIAKFTDTDAVGNSQIFDNGTNVGIGTTAPGSYKLNVQGNQLTSGTLYVDDIAANSGTLEISARGWNTSFVADTDSNSEGNSFVWNTDGTDVMVIDGRAATLGYVGIGTTNPARKLDIISGNNVAQLRLTDGAGDNAKDAIITADPYTTAQNDLMVLFARTNSASNIISLGGQGTHSAGNINGEGVQGATQIEFYTTGAVNTEVTSASAPSMVINSSGNVGIGTTAPAKKLEVYGDIALSNGGIIGQGHDYGTPGNTYNGTLELYNGSTGNSTLQSATSYYLLLNPAGGNVGIGLTNPYGKLSVGGAGWSDATASPDTASFPVAGTGGLVIDGGYTDGRYRSRFAKIDRSGGLPLYVQNSGGTANSFTNIARFGTHSQSTDEFEVFGDAKIGGNSLVTGNTYIGTTDAYFYRDSANRIATPDDFYVQSSSGNTYLYSTTTYLGAGSGDTIRTRGNVVNLGEATEPTNTNVYMDTDEHMKFYYTDGATATQIGDISADDTTWFRINQDTNKNIYTPRYIRADNGLFVDGATYGINGSGTLVSNTGATIGGNTAWHAGNDGAGSGLDADKLDGVEGANYTREDLTMLGKTGNVSLDAATNTAAEWANLPVGYARMISSAIGTAGGAPRNNAGYFLKAGNRDVSGGWGGMWIDYNGPHHYIGRSTTNSTFATWDKLWNNNNDGSGSGLDADLLDGHDSSYFMDNTDNQTLAEVLAQGNDANNLEMVNVNGIRFGSASSPGSWQIYLSGTGYVGDYLRADGGLTTDSTDPGTNNLRVGGAATVVGDMTVSGGDITGANSKSIDIGEQNTDSITFKGTEDARLILNGGYTEFVVPSLFQLNNGLYVNGGTAYFQNTVQLRGTVSDDSNGDVSIGDDMSPTANNTYDLGDASYRWQDIYGVNANFSGTTTIGNLTISGTGNVYQTISTSGTANAAGIRFNDGDVKGWAAGHNGATDSFVIAEGLNSNTTAQIGVNDANNVDRFVIKNGGNVGIGTTDPGSWKLYVTGGNIYNSGITRADGGFQVDGNTVINSDGGLFYSRGASTNKFGTVNASGMGFDALNSGDWDILVYESQTYTSNLALGYSGGATLSTYDANENLTIDPNGTGQVILNGTLDLNGNASISGYVTDDLDLQRDNWITFYGDSSTSHGIGSRANTGGEADDLRINSYGSIYLNLDSNNNNTDTANFLIGRHGSATGTIANQEYFFLNGENGNVGIGTTNPGYDLDVAGDINFTGTLYQNGVAFTSGGGGGNSPMLLQAEYDTAVIDTSACTNHSGKLSTGNTRDSETPYWTNYYQWEATSTTAQEVEIIVSIGIPEGFSSWAASNAVQVQFKTETTTASDCAVSVYAYKQGEATLRGSDTANASTSWTNMVIDDSALNATSWATGNYIVLRIRLLSASGNFAKVGNIILNFDE